jgi:hypothetical protein
MSGLASKNPIQIHYALCQKHIRAKRPAFSFASRPGIFSEVCLHRSANDEQNHFGIVFQIVRPFKFEGKDLNARSCPEVAGYAAGQIPSEIRDLN